MTDTSLDLAPASPSYLDRVGDELAAQVTDPKLLAGVAMVAGIYATIIGGFVLVKKGPDMVRSAAEAVSNAYHRLRPTATVEQIFPRAVPSTAG